MAFVRQRFLILAVLALGAGPVWGASREDRDYAAATGAFHDHLWPRAEADLANFIHKYPESPNLAEAAVLEAQAQFQQGKFVEALALLAAQKPGAGPLADQYDYWIGEIQSVTGDYTGAANTFIGLTQNYPGSAIRLQATIEAAASLASDHRWPRVTELLADPAGVFLPEAQLAKNKDNGLVTRGWLLLAQAQAAQNDFAGAAGWLERIKTVPLGPDLEWQRLHLLGQVKLGAGDRPAALTVITNALQAAQAAGRADWLAASRGVLATALEKSDRVPEAAAVWQANLTNAAPAEAQREAVRQIAALAATPDGFTNAEAVLGGFIDRVADPATAELAELTLGRLQLKDFANGTGTSNLLAAARGQFERVLANTNSPLAAQARLGHGWCNWLAGQIPASQIDFQKAELELLAHNGSVEDLAVARFKTGDTEFAQTNYAAALGSYRTVLETIDGQPGAAKTLGDRALYQILRSELNLTNVPAAEQTLAQFLAVYPHSDLATNSLLLAGTEFSDFGLPAKARVTLLQCEKLLSPDSPLRPQVELAVAHTYEGEQDWPKALAAYADWLGRYPAENPLRPQVEYARAQANFLAGNETNALALFTAFLTRYPADELAPQAQWWLADYYFRTTSLAGSENYGAAETNYENIFQNTNAAWTASPLFYPAQLMAGRAAMGRLGYSDACGYFTNLLGDAKCPRSVALQARFAYGEALMQTPPADTNTPLANFQLATNLFGQVCRLDPADDNGARAWAEIGNCAVQLGDFPAATNAYAQAVSLPAAAAATRHQAEVGLGIALEKFAEQPGVTNGAALREMALQHFYTVFSGDDGADDSNEVFWRKEAGWQTLQLLPALHVPPATATNFINHLEAVFPQLIPALEQKKAALAPAKSGAGI